MDATGMALRLIQYEGGERIDAVFKRLAIIVEKIILKHQEFPNGPLKPGVLTAEGKEKAMREISALMLGAEDELIAIIDGALDATVRMAQETDE
jgi:hypothetical protein